MYEYKLIRSDRKTLSLQVTESCEIIVRAPKRCSQSKIDKIVSEHEMWLDKAIKKQQKASCSRLTLTDKDITYLKRLAAEILPKKVDFYASVIDVEVQSVKITSAQKRFGSCSSNNNICFSYMLMLYPDEAIDYVVVHELAHTVHHNHSHSFYSLIQTVLPDYKQREELLKGPQIMP